MSEGLTVVTGAAGFIGHALCAHLRDRKRPFTGTVRALPSDRAADLHPAGDLMLADDAVLDELFRHAAAVVHLAGRAHVMRESKRDSERLYRRANVDLTRRLAEAAVRNGIGRFVLASTVKVNGEWTRPERPFRPADAPKPADAYARSKLAAEHALFEAVVGSQTIPIVVRLPLVYGRNAKGNFARLVSAVVMRRTLPLASIRNCRSLLYVGNLVEAIESAIAATTAPRGVHFVADAEAVSTPDLARAIAVALKVEPRLVAVPVPLLKLAALVTARGALITRLTKSLEVDTSSFRAATGWTPRFSLDAALARTAPY